MNKIVESVKRLCGSPWLPADKSISHRAAILAALANGRSVIGNYSNALDPQSTLSVLKSLGVPVSVCRDRVEIEGTAISGLHAPSKALDCGNSGTTMRLMSGVLAGARFPSVLVGDASLGRRPMERIAKPLRLMGGRIALDDGHPPVRISPVEMLHGITYALPVASAQVKSCILLAGLQADGPTTVVERSVSRDHTERMMGLECEMAGALRRTTVFPGRDIESMEIRVPADFSAASFFLVAGAMVADARVQLEAVGINPTRAALLDLLREMGARITSGNTRMEGNEPVADIEVRSSDLSGIDLDPRLVPNVIDEIPILLVAATQASGVTRIRGAEELRHKETDRIAAMAKNLAAMGVDVEEYPDGLSVSGGRKLSGATVSSFDDHRIAMAMGVAGLIARGSTTVQGAEATAVSFPGFWDELGRLGAQIR